MTKKNTPLIDAIALIQAELDKWDYCKYTAVNGALKFCIDICKKQLPAEREAIEGAYGQGVYDTCEVITRIKGIDWTPTLKSMQDFKNGEKEGKAIEFFTTTYNDSI